jgi:STE24 endopeptidase
MTDTPPVAADTKKYNRTKIIISVCEIIFTVAFIVAILVGGLSLRLEEYVRGFVENPYLVLIGFVVVLALAEKIIWLPVDFYAGYVLEHTYQLSNQTILRWAWEDIKGMLVGAVIFIPLLLAFYALLRSCGAWWWLPAATMLFLLSVVLAQLAPVLIMPLFYKFIPLADEELKQRLMAMGQKVGFTISGVFSFNLSKNTKKANAALAGLGRTRRIILADTLLEKFTPDEVAAVFAHELGHHVYGHIRKGVALGTLTTFAGLYITSVLYAWSLPAFGFTDITRPAALPLLVLWLTLYFLITSPLQNTFSRKHERQADRYAVQSMGQAEAFVSALEKLAALNLGDKEPHPLVEFFFYSHPALGKRIKEAQESAKYELRRTADCGLRNSD